MKKTLFIIILAAIFCFSLVGCTQTAAEKTLTAVWNTSDHNYEKLTYEVTRSDLAGVTGEYTTEITRVFNNDVTIGTEVYTSVTADLLKSTLNFGDTYISETVLFGATNSSQRLSPFSSARTTTTDISTKTQAVVYNGNKCVLYENGSSIGEIELDAPYYDNAQLYAILRSAGTEFSFSVSVPIVAEGKTVTLLCAALTGTSDITVPYSASAITCYRVSITRDETLTGTPIYLYYASGSITVDDKTVSNPLVKIVEGDTTYSLKEIEAYKIV